MTEESFCMINGELLPAKAGMISIQDLTIQRGYGIFDFFKVIAGQPVFLTDHLNRFMHSATAMRLDHGLDKTDLQDQVRRLVQQHHYAESGIRLTLTGGVSSDGYSIATPNLIITETPITLDRDMPPGIRLMTYPFQRQLPAVKTIDYLMAIWLQPLIRQQNVQDVLYVGDGMARECPRANFFIINRHGELQTSKEKLLYGVTRRKVLDLAKYTLPVLEQDISMADLQQAREAFITSTTKHITPVLAIDGKPVGEGTAGRFTRQLSKAYLKVLFPEESAGQGRDSPG